MYRRHSKGSIMAPSVPHPQLPKLVAKDLVTHKSYLTHTFEADSSSNRPLKNLTSLKSIGTESMDKDELINQFLSKATDLSINDAIESFMCTLFSDSIPTFWRDVSKLSLLINPTCKVMCSHNDGIIGSVYQTRTPVIISPASKHPEFSSGDSKRIGSDNSLLAFPLYDYKNSIYGIVQIVKQKGLPEFRQRHLETAEWFVEKFKLISKLLINQNQNIDPLLLNINQIPRTESYAIKAFKFISDFFNCRSCDIWHKEIDSDLVTRIGTKNTSIKLGDCGIVQSAILSENVVNVQINRLHGSYRPEVDGTTEESVLCLPVFDSSKKNIFVITLRGSKETPIFLTETENMLKRAAPHIIAAFETSHAYKALNDENYDNQKERNTLVTLLEIAELLSSQLDRDTLLKTIMEKGQSLVGADRCSVFIANPQRDRLVSRFQAGLLTAIEVPTNQGIAGHTFRERKPIIVEDAYSCNFFDASVDETSGYHTRSLVCVPVFNAAGDIIGVTEMINKADGSVFSEQDTHVVQIFNVFVGISLENAELYRVSHEASRQLRSFVDVVLSMHNLEDNKAVLESILQNARKTIGAEAVSLFLIDEASKLLSTCLNDGGKLPPTIPLEEGLAGHAARLKEPIISNDTYHDPKFNRHIDQVSGFKTRNLLAVPVIAGDSETIGVVEVVNKANSDFDDRDIELVQSFAGLAGIVLENNRLKEVARIGEAGIEIEKYIGETERNRDDEIPVLLKVSEEEKLKIESLNFFSVEFKGIGHIKELFYIFNKFGVLQEFKISNERFFKFIFAIRDTYNDVPYHNWIHACDVTQYVAYELTTAKLDTVFTKFEIFALLSAAVCHDANHGGFNNVFNVKSETPLGILYQGMSVMEVHHINVAIQIMDDPTLNLFHSLQGDELKQMWHTFIDLILATDMAKHGALVKAAVDLCDAGPYNITVPENRLLAMQLLMKVADVSNVSRPFDVADRWCDILNGEFFRQGDLEKANGVGLTSPLNDREHPDKPKSQIGFYNFVCIPLYQVVARIFPPLQVNCDSVKQNLGVWQALKDEATNNATDKK